MAKQSPSFLRKLWKLKYNFNPILQNQFVLYFVFLLALVEIVYFLNIWDLRSVVFFLTVGFLASFFSKNMIVILTITLALTNIMKFGVRPAVEGMENAEKESEEEKEEEKKENFDEKEPKKESDKESNKESNTNENPDMKDINADLKQFDNLQKEIISGMKDIGGLLDKAEGFVEKYKSYDFKNIKNSKNSEPQEVK
jgi:hypothetical protein